MNSYQANTSKEYQEVFCDLHPPLTAENARAEASRCYYCYDAPCIQACPTEIDIPSFIRKISNGNRKGAAMDILEANIMGGTCSRVCPVEVLCQSACVREKSESKPVEIGRLQRFATEEVIAESVKSGTSPFKRNGSNGKKIAVVGAGPAGLSCAHRLAVLGYEVTVFDAKEKSGGLNEYGLAPYKVTDEFVQKEVNFILSVGGIGVQYGQVLGETIKLEKLRSDFSAVFLGIGLGDSNLLSIPGEDLSGVIDATQFIQKIRQTKELASLPVGRNVVVVGGGNTAVDIAVQMRKLGAESVTLVYRRGEAQMGATHYEQELAQKSGVLIKTWAKPIQIKGDQTGVREVDFETTRMGASGKLENSGSFFTLKADQVFKAIGQKLDTQSLMKNLSSLELVQGKIWVNHQFETSLPCVYAGGDCISVGADLTVTAVQHGKLAALSIHRKFELELELELEGKAHG